MKATVLITSVLLSLILPKALAQYKVSEKRFGFEINSGISVATQHLYNANLNVGFGFESVLHYSFLPHTGIYAGWGYNNFSANNSFAGNNANFEETGYVLGLQFKQPIDNYSFSYFFRTGAIYNHIEIEDKKGKLVTDSKHGFGFQLASGLSIPINNTWQVLPGIKFNALSRNTHLNGSKINLNLNYLSFRIGVLKSF